jgi:hypothetical protein
VRISVIRDAVVINAVLVMVTVDLSLRYVMSQDLDVLHTDLGYFSTAASLSDANLTSEDVVMQHQSLPLRLRLRLHPHQRQLPRHCRPQAQSLSPQAHRLYRHSPLAP